MTFFSKLSCCIEGLHSLLMPFSWQHTYVPVLPAKMIELCEAPTPYIIGLLNDTENLKSQLDKFTEVRLPFTPLIIIISSLIKQRSLDLGFFLTLNC